MGSDKDKKDFFDFEATDKKLDYKEELLEEVEDKQKSDLKKDLDDFMNLLPRSVDDYDLTILRKDESNKSKKPKWKVVDSYHNETISLKDLIEIYGGGDYMLHLKFEAGGKTRLLSHTINIEGLSKTPDRLNLPKDVPVENTRKDVLEEMKLLTEMLPYNKHNGSDESNQIMAMMFESSKQAAMQAQENNKFMITMMMEMQKANMNMFQVLLSDNKGNQSNDNSVDTMLKGMEIAQGFMDGDKPDNSFVSNIGALIGSVIKGYIGDKKEQKDDEDIDEESEEPKEISEGEQLLNKYDVNTINEVP